MLYPSAAWQPLRLAGPFYRWGNWRWERWSKLPTVMEQVWERVRVIMEAWLTLSGLFPRMLCCFLLRGMKEAFTDCSLPQIFLDFSRLALPLSPGALTKSSVGILPAGHAVPLITPPAPNRVRKISLSLRSGRAFGDPPPWVLLLGKWNQGKHFPLSFGLTLGQKTMCHEWIWKLDIGYLTTVGETQCNIRLKKTRRELCDEYCHCLLSICAVRWTGRRILSSFCHLIPMRGNCPRSQKKNLAVQGA